MISILYVDDEPGLVALLRHYLQQTGEFQVLTAGSGPEALALLERHPVDVVVSDYQMPGMNGIETPPRVPATVRRAPVHPLHGPGARGGRDRGDRVRGRLLPPEGGRSRGPVRRARPQVPPGRSVAASRGGAARLRGAQPADHRRARPPGSTVRARGASLWSFSAQTRRRTGCSGSSTLPWSEGPSTRSSRAFGRPGSPRVTGRWSGAGEPWHADLVTYRDRKDRGGVPGLGLLESGRDRIVAQFIDIADRLALEEELRELGRRWEVVFEAIGQPAMILSPDQEILSVNRAAERATGLTAEEMVGRQCAGVFHGSCRLARVLSVSSAPAVGGGTGARRRLVIEAMGGTYLVSCTPIYDDDGRIEKVVHLATEITDRIRHEQELRMSHDKLALISNVTRHDLRNRLMALQGYLRMTEREADPERRARYRRLAHEIGSVDGADPLVRGRLRAHRDTGPRVAAAGGGCAGRPQRGRTRRDPARDRDRSVPRCWRTRCCARSSRT